MIKDTDMNNQHLDSNDTAKLLIFTLLLVPSIVFGFGILPTIFLVFGLYMMKKTQSFSHIETAIKSYKIYMHAAFIVGILFTLYWGNKYYTYKDYSDEFGASFILTFIPIIYIVLINVLFKKPLSLHSNWVEKNGLFTTKTGEQSKDKGLDMNIIKGGELRSYSVADELIKWNDLLEKKLISLEEFNKAKNKLLN